MRARVFISCGQNTNSDEVETANDIAKVLEGLHYEPYIAVMEQTLKGVTENIFRRLQESEYFLFIDFKRERIEGRNCHRGSLFSHQELAIAAFLGKSVIGFQEQPVCKHDGVAGFLQANFREFSERGQLPHMVASAVTERWNPDWRDELEIGRDPIQGVEEVHPFPGFAQGRRVRYFHMTAANRNKFKTAVNCYAYLVKVATIPDGRDVPIKEVEFKWRGVTFPNVIIPPEKSQEFDGFWAYIDEPDRLRTGALTDSPKHLHFFGQGEYRLTFAVRSENFPEARKQFYLRIGGGSVDNVTLRAT